MEKFNSIPTICIVGRPNVGKSSLFNAILGERKAVVVEQSGTTRDRVEAVISTHGSHFKIVDTGGYLLNDEDVFSSPIKEQILRAVEEASVVLFVVDAQAGGTPADDEVALLVRKFNKPVMLVANKADNDRIKDGVVEFYRFGFGEPVAVSCLHRKGVRALRKTVLASMIGMSRKAGDTRHMLKVAIAGRPNVGKSSFVNRLLMEDRVIVSDVPGTTRDPVDTYFKFEHDEFILIDTAGIRHKRKVKQPVDAYSMMRSREAIQRSDVSILMLDAADGMTRDDLDILNYVEQQGKGCLVLVNKWDLARDAEGVTQDDYLEQLHKEFNILRKFPVKFISCESGKNVLKSLSITKVLDAGLDIKVSTAYLNKLFENKDPGLVPIPRRKKRPNFLYAVQSGHRPVKFRYYVNDPSAVLMAHMNFIENVLRDGLPLKGIPVSVEIKSSRRAGGEK